MKDILIAWRDAGRIVKVFSRHGTFEGQLASDEDGEWWYTSGQGPNFGFDIDDVIAANVDGSGYLIEIDG